MGTTVARPAAAQLPAAIQKALAATGAEVFDEFSHGVTSGFPVISYRGKTWRIREKGEERAYLDENGDSIQSVELVLVRSNPQPSKIHYDRQFEEGDESPPRCWSADGIRPDSGVQDPISKSCATCPNNVWGSRITENGKKSRACSDVRRMAVAFKHHIEMVTAGEMAAEDVPVTLLRVPPASLNPLKDYVEKTLKPKSIPPFCVVSRVGFDTAVAYPKLTFKASRFLSEEEVDLVVALRGSDAVKRILAESIEHEGAGTTEAADAVAADQPAPAPAAAAPAPSARSKLRPAEEEELNAAAGTELELDEIAPPPASPAAVDDDDDDDDGDEIAPPPPPAAAAGKKKVTKKKVTKAAPAPAPVADDGDDDGDGEESFDDMLSAILDS